MLVSFIYLIFNHGAMWMFYGLFTRSPLTQPLTDAHVAAVSSLPMPPRARVILLP